MPGLAMLGVAQYSVKLHAKAVFHGPQTKVEVPQVADVPPQLPLPSRFCMVPPAVVLLHWYSLLTAKPQALPLVAQVPVSAQQLVPGVQTGVVLPPKASLTPTCWHPDPVLFLTLKWTQPPSSKVPGAAGEKVKVPVAPVMQQPLGLTALTEVLVAAVEPAGQVTLSQSLPLGPNEHW